MNAPRFAGCGAKMDRVVFTAEGARSVQFGFPPEDIPALTSELLAAARAVREHQARRRGEHEWMVEERGGRFIVRHRQQECPMRSVRNGRGWNCWRCRKAVAKGEHMFACDGKPAYLPGTRPTAVHDWSKARLCAPCVRPLEDVAIERLLAVVDLPERATR